MLFLYVCFISPPSVYHQKLYNTEEMVLINQGFTVVYQVALKLKSAINLVMQAGIALLFLTFF